MTPNESAAVTAEQANEVIDKFARYFPQNHIAVVLDFLRSLVAAHAQPGGGVVVPDELDIHHAPYESSFDSETYVEGYNKCRAEVLRLNAAPSTVVPDGFVARVNAQGTNIDVASDDPTTLHSEVCDWLKRNAGKTFSLNASPAPQVVRDVACTCPSGDGSLRWPCPRHPPAAPAVAAQDALWSPGDRCVFRGDEYKIRCRGDRQGTWELEPIGKGDVWRNVPPSELTPTNPAAAPAAVETPAADVVEGMVERVADWLARNSRLLNNNFRRPSVASDYMDDAKACIAAAGVPALVAERDEAKRVAQVRLRDLERAMERSASAHERAEQRARELEEVLAKLRLWNDSVLCGRINYRPEDHLTVIDAALASARQEGA